MELSTEGAQRRKEERLDRDSVSSEAVPEVRVVGEGAHDYDPSLSGQRREKVGEQEGFDRSTVGCENRYRFHLVACA